MNNRCLIGWREFSSGFSSMVEWRALSRLALAPHVHGARNAVLFEREVCHA